jgi:ubiquitin carboxyl-terminal hydrolase 7
VTAEKFKVHQGFDLTNFDDRQYPLSEVYTYKIIKGVTYGIFKDSISLSFNIPQEQVRFWVIVNRQNKTIRPDAPIPENYISTSNIIFNFFAIKIYYNFKFIVILNISFNAQIAMGEINAKMSTRRNEIKLYMEIAEKPINGKVQIVYISLSDFLLKFKLILQYNTSVDMAPYSFGKSHNCFSQTF